MIDHELIRKICKRAGVDLATGNHVLLAMFLTIKQEVIKGNRVRIDCFGSFYLLIRHNVTVYNRNSRQKYIKPKSISIRFVIAEKYNKLYAHRRFTKKPKNRKK